MTVVRLLHQHEDRGQARSIEMGVDRFLQMQESSDTYQRYLVNLVGEMAGQLAMDMHGTRHQIRLFNPDRSFRRNDEARGYREDLGDYVANMQRALEVMGSFRRPDLAEASLDPLYPSVPAVPAAIESPKPEKKKKSVAADVRPGVRKLILD